MKKIVMLVITAICISLLSGCGDSGKKLVCSYNISEDGTNRMEYVLNFDSKGEKIKAYTQSAIAIYDDGTSDEEFDSEYEEASKSCDNYQDMKGVKCTSSKGKKEIRVDLKVTMAELDATGKESLSTAEIEDLSYDEFKTFMESASFSCK